MPRKPFRQHSGSNDRGRYTWRDRLDDRLEALATFDFGPVAPGESRPGLSAKVFVLAMLCGLLAIGLAMAYG